MPDVPLVNRAAVTAPKDYTLPQAQSIVLRAVQAEIDGTRAAGSFLPVVQLISDAGDVMWTALDRNTTIAAGGTASVTWFPNVKPETSGSSSGSAVNWAYLGATATKSCGAGVNTVLPANTAQFYTNASTVFTTGVDGSGNHGIVISTAGHYFSSMTAQPFGVPTAGTLIELVTLGGGASSRYEGPPTNALNSSGTVSDEWRLREDLIFTVGGSVSPPAPAITCEIDNYGTHAVTMMMNAHYIFQLDTNGTDL